jgi:hypothetical protein
MVNVGRPLSVLLYSSNGLHMLIITKSVSCDLLKICLECNCQREAHVSNVIIIINMVKCICQQGADSAVTAITGDRLDLPSAKVDIIISVSTMLRLILFSFINFFKILKHVNDNSDFKCFAIKHLMHPIKNR